MKQMTESVTAAQLKKGDRIMRLTYRGMETVTVVSAERDADTEVSKWWPDGAIAVVDTLDGDATCTLFHPNDPIRLAKPRYI